MLRLFINPHAQQGLRYLVYVSVCVSVTQHLTFHVFIHTTNDTNLLGSLYGLPVLLPQLIGGGRYLRLGGGTDDGACVSMHAQGGLGACSLRKILKLGALRLLLRPYLYSNLYLDSMPLEYRLEFSGIPR